MNIIIALALSMLRMFLALFLSILVAYLAGIPMGSNEKVEKILYPIIDVLQSVPILGFFPLIILLFVNNLPGWLGPELASIFLIFTSQSWNLIIGVYSAVKVIPQEIIDMANIYKLSTVAKIFKIYIPYSKQALARNILISWAGGLFFLTASEVITLGSTNYELTGIGTYIQMAADSNNFSLVFIGTFILMITSVLIYVLFLNPFFNSTAGEGKESFKGLSVDILYEKLTSFFSPLVSKIVDGLIIINGKINSKISLHTQSRNYKFIASFLLLAFLSVIILFNIYSIIEIPKAIENYIAETFQASLILNGIEGLLISTARVVLVMMLGLIFLILISYYLYEKPTIYRSIFTLAGEVLASMPSILWWPIFLLLIERGFSPLLVSFFIIFQGSIWYIFFNVFLTGIGSIEKNLMEMSRIYKIRGIYKLFYIYIPMISPYLVAGLSAGWGGAWNADIVAEYASIGTNLITFFGIGYLISLSTYSGNMLALSTYVFLLVMFIIIVNRTVWAFMYSYIKKKYHVID
ncbi:ABC transporter permease subunit [Fervidicoccus fontis]|uniref:ABC transporter permease subunit n=1 Tax=Fervidicoccus fontis TaxID=683846 RepID=A0A2J6N4H1_9CREN|nr:ABC transporter permease subunit [Fervidicoccus fontis]PMB76136.1 MAG: hypothetical protein C0188_00485 [Fervidicoccus fontis]PMB77663.1 MAG: hypothetical protein C0177_02710 [Fervidicoccus fontis]HEW64424.1 ABC transporter permease subunit [Fervidicoccus fontis]